MKSEKGIYRKYLIPKCPMCGKGVSPASHLNCNRTIQKETLWIDISTGKIICDSCHFQKDLTTTENLCSCGAIFRGGYLWQELGFEYGKVINFEWFRALEISKGSLKTKFVRWAFPFPEYEALKGYKVKNGCNYICFLTFDDAINYIKKENTKHGFYS